MADTDTAPAPTPGVDYNALIQQLLQGGGNISGPPAPATPAVNPNLPITSLLGEAFGGGVSPLYPMSEAQQTQAGNAALLNFGIGMLQNASGPVRHSLGQAIASGLLGAQGSLAGVREGQAQMLDIQNKQQTMRLEQLKELLPLLRMQQAAGMPNPLAGNLAATGDPISALPKDQALAAIVQRESAGKNIPTAILGPDGKPASTASGYYQMLDDTWHEAATLAGIKNPPARAMDASKADQDAAASALYDKYGVVPWKKSAPGTPTTAPPVATAVTSDTKATTTPPAATALPPGVTIGDPTKPQLAPAPPGGTVAGTGPYTGGGIGATLNQPSTGKPPGVVGALMQGVNIAQATPIVPGTGLTAGPPTIGKPATLATTTPQSTAAPITIGNYNDTPAPTTTPPAQPVPQQPTQADQPPAPGGKMTFEQFRAQHPMVVDPTTFTVPPPDVSNFRSAQQAASQAYRQAQINGDAAGMSKATAEYNAATKGITDTQQAAAAKSLELQQAAQKNALDTQRQLYNDEMTRQQQAELKAQELAAQTALKTQEGQQAIELAKVNAGQTWHQKLQEQSAQNAQENTLKPMAEQAAKAHNMNLSLAQLQPLLQDLPPGGGALGAVLNDHPDLAPLFNQAGILNDKSADAVRLVNGLVANISTQMKPTGLGALREYEWDAFKSQLPSMLSTPAGQQKAIALLMNMNNRIGSEASWMNNYFNRKVPDDMSPKPGAMAPAHNLDSDSPNESVQQRMDRELGPIVPSAPPGSSQAQWEQSLPPGKPYYKTWAMPDPKNPGQPLRDQNGNIRTTRTLEVRPWQ
jgi:hypothetical protein